MDKIPPIFNFPKCSDPEILTKLADVSKSRVIEVGVTQLRPMHQESIELIMAASNFLESVGISSSSLLDKTIYNYATPYDTLQHIITELEEALGSNLLDAPFSPDDHPHPLTYEPVYNDDIDPLILDKNNPGNYCSYTELYPPAPFTEEERLERKLLQEYLNSHNT